MLYLVNFFTRKIEAVSKQVEDARVSTSDKIITCGYFLNQKILSPGDIKDGIWVFPKWLYPIVAFLILIFTTDDVHLFEDEPSWWRKFGLNFRKRKLYISLFKDINLKLIQFLGELKNLTAVSVEDEVSYKFVQANLQKKNVKTILCYPSSLWHPTKPKKVVFGHHILFASWNGGDLASLKDRGIYDMLQIIKKHEKYTGTIILRDGQTDVIKSLINSMKLEKRVNLVDPHGDYYLVRKEFEKAQYVMLAPRKPIMKYVPNSIIDGLSMGKPCIITDQLRFSPTVEAHKLGLIYSSKKLKTFKLASKEEYSQLMENCHKWSKKYLIYPYHSAISRIYQNDHS